MLPNVGHTYIKVTPLDLRFPFYSSRAFGMGVEGRFALLGITSSGDIEAEDRSGWGNASGYGLDVGASLFTRLYYFELAAAFDYRRIVMSFDGDCVRLGLGCNLAGGATDQTTMFTMRAAIKY